MTGRLGVDVTSTTRPDGSGVRTRRHGGGSYPRGMSTTPRRAVAALLVILGTVVGIAGCSSSSSSDGQGSGPTTTRRPVPTTTLAGTKGPGIALFAGLDVLPGSRLIGTVFPNYGTGTASIGLTALLSVDGDPGTVYAAYLRAMTDLGYRLGQTDCGNPAPREPIVCATTGLAESDTDATLQLGFVAPPHGRKDFTTTILLTQSRADEDTAGAPQVPSSDPAGVIAATKAAAVEAAKVPGVGEPIAPKGSDDDAGIVVAEGSELIDAAVPINGVTAGWSAVARVTGDPEAVRDAYTHRPGWGTPTNIEATVGSAHILAGEVSRDAGGTLQVVLVEDVSVDEKDAPGRWVMLITRTLD